MDDAGPGGARVLLAAADTAGLRELAPAREALAGFGITCAEALGDQADAAAAGRVEIEAVIVASPDGTLPAAYAAATSRPVVRVPTADAARSGLALLHDPDTADLPAAPAPFATVAIGEAGAKNAALFVVSALAQQDPRLWTEWIAFRQRQTDAVLASPPLTLD